MGFYKRIYPWVVQNWGTYFFIPIVLFADIISLFKSEIQETVESTWTPVYNSAGLNLERLFIHEIDLPEIFDYPGECNDLHMFKIKSVPEIKDLKICF